MIIGISGAIGAGKDTLGDFFVTHGFTKVGFADPMRAAAVAIDPVIGIDSTGEPIHWNEALDVFGYEELKELYPEARRFLQRLGTEFGRDQINRDFWVDMAFARFKPDDKVVITDVRFQNEARAIANHGGVTVSITRRGIDRFTTHNHTSETDLVDWPFDFTVANDAHPSALGVFAANVLQVVNGYVNQRAKV